MKKHLLLSLMVICSVSIAHSKNYYVSKGATGTGTKNSPYGNISQAAKVASPGDTVFIAGGTYSEMNIKPAKSGTRTGGMVVYTALPETGEVIITKENNASGDDNNPIFDLSSLSYILIGQITFNGMSYLRACIDLSNAKNCVVTSCKFQSLGNEDIAPSWAGTSMIWLNGSQDCVVSYCYFENLYGDAINFYGQNAKGNLFFSNSFVGLKGKKRSWDNGKGKYSSSITGTDGSFGDNLICFNHITKGAHGIWLDRDASHNIVVRNYSNGGQTLVFNESRCAGNWIQENVATNITDAAYRSATYDGTNWSFDTRYINNVAYKCKVGFYIHKSKHNEIRNNIAYNNTNYNMVFTDSAYHYGSNNLRNNFWFTATKEKSMLFRNKEASPSTVAKELNEVSGIYRGSPGFKLTTGPAGFLLNESSSCVAAGDGAIDMGAYPIYKYADMGCNQPKTTTTVLPYVEKLVTEVLRGESYKIKISLTKASAKPIKVKLLPVAGDAIADTDYELQKDPITFLPGETQKEVSINIIGEETDFAKLLILRLCSEESDAPFESRSYTAFKILTKEYYESMKNSDIYLEVEDGAVGSLWQVLSDNKASGGKYVMVKSGNNSNDSAPATAAGWVDINFSVTRPTTYVLWLRTICPNANDDSFWLRLDNEDWSQWNGIPNSSSWKWNKCSRTFNMLEGEHTLHIGYREDGAKLDKLMFSCLGTIPEGMGGTTGVVSLDKDYNEVISTTYYNISGHMVSSLPSNSIVIKRMVMKNGIVKSEKVFIKK